nr:immunoglobulin light chain junction region [Macaca mulatta]MOV94634.1 immunoglobulin light chain junction region [Macaca mulatta]MOV94644.1 immunoglobulin light chain junction region [Macaca mulatta]MOV94647.1 immunoglobulin light chain junction region [Macaca mulatta]MOV94729.1 immunoglobulin light chain junction region [Macaca mulatta]
DYYCCSYTTRGTFVI